MIGNAVMMTHLVNQFIEETGWKLKSIKKEVDVCDLLKIDEKTNKVINYGNVNDILNSNEFKIWYNSRGDNNG